MGAEVRTDGALAAPGSPLAPNRPAAGHVGPDARRAVAILTGDLVIVLVGNAIPGPLLPAYRATWHLAALATTLIFAIYAAGVLAAIVCAGRIADQVGPRPVIVAALGFGAACGGLALAAPSVGWLYGARVLQGIAAALVGGAATTAITEVSGEPGAGARWAAIGTTGGIALGLLLAGAVGQLTSAALTWSWVVYLALLAAAAAATVTLDGALVLRGRPRLALNRPGLPDHGVGAFVRAIAGASLAFGCMGLLAGLGPSLAAAVGIDSVLGEAAVAALAYVVSGVTLVTVGSRVGSALPGLVVLLIGLVPLIVAVHVASPAWLLAGAAVVGLGNGLTFRVTLAEANRLAPPDRRFEIVSTYNVAMYGGIVAALLGIAVLADGSSLRRATAVVTAVIAAGVIALIVSLLAARDPRSRAR